VPCSTVSSLAISARPSAHITLRITCPAIFSSQILSEIP
jgi:hypothetical protein